MLCVESQLPLQWHHENLRRGLQRLLSSHDRGSGPVLRTMCQSTTTCNCSSRRQTWPLLVVTCHVVHINSCENKQTNKNKGNKITRRCRRKCSHYFILSVSFYHYQKALPQSRAWAFQRRKTSPLVSPPPLLLLSHSSDVIRHFI